MLKVFAHPGSQSCRAVLDRFDSGLRDAGHTNDIVDLYAIGVDPILCPRDNPSWLTETIPNDMLERMRLRENLLDEVGGLNYVSTVAASLDCAPITARCGRSITGIAKDMGVSPRRGSHSLSCAAIPGVAESVAVSLGIPLFAKDWLEAPLLSSQIVPRDQLGVIGYNLLTTLARQQLLLGQSAILDSVASTTRIRNS